LYFKKLVGQANGTVAADKEDEDDKKGENKGDNVEEGSNWND